MKKNKICRTIKPRQATRSVLKIKIRSKQYTHPIRKQLITQHKRSNHLKFKLKKNLKPKLGIKDGVRELPWWITRCTKFESFVNSKKLMSTSIKAKTAQQYRSIGKKFYGFLAHWRTKEPELPKIEDLLNNFDIFQLDSLVYNFLTLKFNAKANTGGTLRNNACGILYCMACDFGISISCDMLPGVRRICKGADNYLEEVYGERQIGKFPILLPILEKMLKHATKKERIALLIAVHFCLRSQHYCNNRNIKSKKKNKYVKRENFYFIPNQRNPRAVSIATGYDKNNPHLEHMERVVYCTCGKTKWTCLVHEAKRYFDTHYLPPQAALVQCDSGDMHYKAMLNIVKKLIKKIGLNPDNYGTHSCRSGGTTELFMIGKQAIWIQNFGWWNNIGSVLIYVRPNNPDITQVFGSMVEYQELRTKEGKILEENEANLVELQLQVATQGNKKKRAKRIHKKMLNAAFMSGPKPIRQPLNRQHQAFAQGKQIYTEYGQHTYQFEQGKWEFNPYAPPRMVPSNFNEMRVPVGLPELEPILNRNPGSLRQANRVINNDKQEIE